MENNREIRYSLVFKTCRLAYVILAVLYLFFIFTYAMKLYQIGYSNDSVIKIVDAIIPLVGCIFIQQLFLYTSIAYKEFWMSKNSSLMEKSVSKMIQMLYAIAIIDGIQLLFKILTGVQYGIGIQTSELAKSLDENKHIFSAITEYFIPRPLGIFAFLLGLFLSHMWKSEVSRKKVSNI